MPGNPLSTASMLYCKTDKSVDSPMPYIWNIISSTVFSREDWIFGSDDKRVASKPQSSIACWISSGRRERRCSTRASSVKRDTPTDLTPSSSSNLCVMDAEHEPHVMPLIWKRDSSTDSGAEDFTKTASKPQSSTAERMADTGVSCECTTLPSFVSNDTDTLSTPGTASRASVTSDEHAAHVIPDMSIVVVTFVARAAEVAETTAASKPHSSTACISCCGVTGGVKSTFASLVMRETDTRWTWSMASRASVMEAEHAAQVMPSIASVAVDMWNEKKNLEIKELTAQKGGWKADV
ncbi:hypothetical protein CLUG_05332 [Clavispora lusitaniae ATCC 42720]|uniref:Uncharacterized protein n=1 Tax=Clavispora lusitaniae (strain ATCC 42720) TaxID=306902 RepID=C4YB40_CLAL4|nr:uncharacterized protein CLUG_05332 [Clavispora lusitaniae ATCC 42720]EEQ41205.1 hypothetical protein CLUG_05332 [Clavispora lusitaniae ATCC 42720]